jgi:hypothetical protein
MRSPFHPDEIYKLAVKIKQEKELNKHNNTTSIDLSEFINGDATIKSEQDEWRDNDNRERFRDIKHLFKE